MARRSGFVSRFGHTAGRVPSRRNEGRYTDGSYMQDHPFSDASVVENTRFDTDLPGKNRRYLPDGTWHTEYRNGAPSSRRRYGPAARSPGRVATRRIKRQGTGSQLGCPPGTRWDPTRRQCVTVTPKRKGRYKTRGPGRLYRYAMRGSRQPFGTGSRLQNAQNRAMIEAFLDWLMPGSIE